MHPEAVSEFWMMSFPSDAEATVPANQGVVVRR
jgi:hypothetical protein